MRGPSPRLLSMMLAFICGTIASAATKSLGTPVMVVAGLVGAGFGWALSRSLIRSLF
jgi:uncharacterized membrane protein YeaQ/YmgE (transglycosylase-associated protein family)